jgi:hypothetical protein
MIPARLSPGAISESSSSHWDIVGTLFFLSISFYDLLQHITVVRFS